MGSPVTATWPSSIASLCQQPAQEKLLGEGVGLGGLWVGAVMGTACLRGGDGTEVTDTSSWWPPGFNPMWEETLVFTVHMPEIALVRFLVWDHDPIGRDFIGQRTLAFSSMMPGAQGASEGRGGQSLGPVPLL